MVKANSTTATIPNIEHMAIYGNDDSGTHFSALLMRENLTVSQQSIYDNAINLFGNVYEVTIENTTAEIELERMTSVIIDADGSETVDFNTMSENDKQKLRDFLALSIELQG